MRSKEGEKEIVLGEEYGKYSGVHLVELVSEEEIKKKVKDLAGKISKDYRGKNPIFIGVLNGSFIFMSDLFRELEIDGEVDFIKISSYADQTQTTGTVRLIKDISCDITGRDVIVVEDIVDSGLSMRFLKTRLEESQPKSLRFVTLLMKERAEIGFQIDYVGFVIPDRYVVGYGLDLAQRLRGLKSIYAFK
ncbi:MAG: hypoxanthine phosphoribosyltransferase [Candidatus Marinimicrobia bacterium]|nr:hypoxanthine phosphoribosyltransferase [Candidatus Neomarinimicrobiota bacterium]